MQKNNFLITLFLLGQLLFAGEETFKDLGTYGETYSIKEEDLYFAIEKGAKNFPAEKILLEAKKASKEVFIAKNDVGRCLTTKDRTFDPTKVLEQDINLSEYGVVVKAGTSFNPLEKGFVKSYVLFIDTNDFAQIQLAEQLFQSSGGNLMIIVTNGELYRVLHLTNEIYKADNNVIDAFKLQCAPTVYVQQDKVFFVREFALQKDGPKNPN